MTVSQLIDLLWELKEEDLQKEVKIVSDKDSGSYLCISEGNGKVRVLTDL